MFALRLYNMCQCQSKPKTKNEPMKKILTKPKRLVNIKNISKPKK